MPQVVTHILVPLLIIAIVRDFYLKNKNKKKFSLHYVLIAGLAGIIPDLDIAAFFVLNFFGFTFEQVHKTFTHSIFIPLLFFLLFLLLKNRKIELGRHKLKLSIIFLMFAIGSFMHLILDTLFGPAFAPFYPFSKLIIGIDLVGYLPHALQSLAIPSLDAILLIVWLIYLELKHKISDFI